MANNVLDKKTVTQTVSMEHELEECRFAGADHAHLSIAAYGGIPG